MTNKKRTSKSPFCLSRLPELRSIFNPQTSLSQLKGWEWSTSPGLFSNLVFLSFYHSLAPRSLGIIFRPFCPVSLARLGLFPWVIFIDTTSHGRRASPHPSCCSRRPVLEFLSSIRGGPPLCLALRRPCPRESRGKPGSSWLWLPIFLPLALKNKTKWNILRASPP